MTPLSLSLRAATEADLPEIVAIYNSTIAGRRVTADTEPVSVKSRLPWLREHNAKTRPLWVAELPEGECGTRICAWLSLSAFINGRPAYSGTAEVSLYVAENCRRAGIGRWLIEEAIRRAPPCEITTLIGFIWAHNTPSLRLFEAFGFEHWGNMPRVAVLDGVDRDLAILGKRLVA